ncbi:DUF2163 domain-containing protein [Erythrobacteraceae bacterium CFH 75059]|uniref:DUF2163 domain-containing protein n=1 Tax=Qipengyuania thermophila TaxID=2509361 RepID=UPI00101F4361|nr:DUF2163 domain-containing protein [Qipengyuania thermophila]TCD06841.1 DUF2163 domain-containing protein [Erythrobacteraceae bacterium CFH 75059]
MSRIFFARAVETVATFWRIHRRDGVTLGFTTHDRDLWFDGVRHRAAPGLLPSAIRIGAGLSGSSLDIEGALSHDTIDETDLVAGRFDHATVLVGAVDWCSLEREVLYGGRIGRVARDGQRFSAELNGAVAALAHDPVARTSPTCRARLAGPGCDLSPARFTVEARLAACDPDSGGVRFEGIDAARFHFGTLRWIDGSGRGAIVALRQGGTWPLVCGSPLPPGLAPGMRAWLREGCDGRLETCTRRFGNARNFQGEPFLPGNDLLAQLPALR